jgi:hypothetical protein
VGQQRGLALLLIMRSTQHRPHTEQGRPFPQVSMPVTYRWTLVGVSASILYLVLTVVPVLRNNLDDVRKLFAGISVLALCVVIFWPPIHRQWKAERSAEIEGDISISNGTAKQASFSIRSSQAILHFSPNLEQAAPNYESITSSLTLVQIRIWNCEEEKAEHLIA